MKNTVLAILLAASATAASAEIVMHRDPGCGCCMNWAAQVKAAFGDRVRVIDDTARPAFQRRVGVPPQLGSCHTAIIGAYAFEGHVPIADIKRLIASKPKGVKGLAVVGMPMGSPGMEVPNGTKERYDVIAFGADKPYVFSRH
ncbi:DUF411 domain-containing protein [Sphingomonas sp. 28-62-11]|uniref:DUF411 domain-containing protein n=1 Tax=Sphingomonas sp. 28-62-11 TaxID=1970432 RepID=UPI000BD18230|nr:MAG: metal-binding protein [Sphingomonas sp. 28-62-11]